MTDQTSPSSGPTDPDETTGPGAGPGAAPGAAPDGRSGAGHGSTDKTEPDQEVIPDATFVGQPAKVMRIGTMVKQLLEEVRSAPLDEAARGRLAEVHERSLHELEDGLSPDLVDELRRITLPFSDEGNPSEAELRVAQAQLVGWLEGLFHGLQTALVAQQMSTQVQLAQMRRALPPGSIPPGVGPGGPGGPRGPGMSPQPDDRTAPGQYL